MQISKYLPLGKIIGGHYEIVEVLGDDDFEILYLIKDTHRLENLFVIKELFLASLSFRDNDHKLDTSAKSSHIFEQTKKEVIEETKELQKKSSATLKTYGFFEENNTVYILMEYVKDTPIDNYLKVMPHISTSKKEENTPPPLKKDSTKKEKTVKKEEKKSYAFLKTLLFIVAILVGLSIYAYKMIEENKANAKQGKVNHIEVKTTPIHHPPLTQREDNKTTTTVTKENNQSAEDNKTSSIPEGAEYISPEEQLKREEETNLTNIPQEEIYDDSNIIPQNEIDNYRDAVTVPMAESEPIIQAPTPSNQSPFLGTAIGENTNNSNQQHPSLGTQIGDDSISPF